MKSKSFFGQWQQWRKMQMTGTGFLGLFLGIAVIGTSAGLSAFANDEEVRQIYRSELTRFETDPLVVDPASIQRGMVQVDYTQRVALLVLERKHSCSFSAICVDVMPEAMTIRLPLVSVEKNNCGQRVITARTDDRNRDGELKELVIMDNSGYSCAESGGNLLADTTVEYRTEAPRTVTGKVTTRSSFEGGRLELSKLIQLMSYERSSINLR